MDLKIDPSRIDAGEWVEYRADGWTMVNGVSLLGVTALVLAVCVAWFENIPWFGHVLGAAIALPSAAGAGFFLSSREALRKDEDALHFRSGSLFRKVEHSTPLSAFVAVKYQVEKGRGFDGTNTTEIVSDVITLKGRKPRHSVTLYRLFQTGAEDRGSVSGRCPPIDGSLRRSIRSACGDGSAGIRLRRSRTKAAGAQASAALSR